MEWFSLKRLVLLSTVQSLLFIGFETARFVINLRSSQPCQWYLLSSENYVFPLLICGSRLCRFGVLAPWPLAIWVLTVLVLVRCRPVVQRKVLGIIRLDYLVAIDLIVSSIIPVIQALVRIFVESNPSENKGWDIYSLISSTLLFLHGLACCLTELITRSRKSRKT